MVDTIKELSQLSSKLNQKSDKVNSIISKINGKLDKLNLGLEVWLTGTPVETGDFTCLTNKDGDEQRFQEGSILGYCKIGDQWELAVKDVLFPEIENGYDLDDEEIVERRRPQSLLKTPRTVRIRATSMLPDLLEVFKQEAEKLLASIEEAEEAAEEL